MAGGRERASGDGKLLPRGFLAGGDKRLLSEQLSACLSEGGYLPEASSSSSEPELHEELLE